MKIFTNLFEYLLKSGCVVGEGIVSRDSRILIKKKYNYYLANFLGFSMVC